MLRYLTVKPAYGREYENKGQVLEDFNKGKDFKIQNGPYLSHRDKKFLVKDGYIGIIFSFSGNSYTYDF